MKSFPRIMWTAGSPAPTLAVAMLVAALACGCEGIRGSGNLVSEEREVEDFERLEVSHAFEVEVSQGETPGVTVTADDNLMDRVEVQHKRGALRIGLKRGLPVTRATLRATVTVPGALTEIRASGASQVRAGELASTETLELRASGASSVRVTADVEELRARASGASKVTAAGGAQRVDLEADGASELTLGELAAAAVTARLTGSSEAVVTATDTLEVSLSGASSLAYEGDPENVRESLSGASELRRR